MSLNSENPAEEPVLTVGIITAVVTAVLAVLVAFAVPVSAEQQVAILGLVAAVAPLVMSWFARRRVFSPATVRKLLSTRVPRTGPPVV